MAARPRLAAPGLRGRIVGLVFFITVATLAVAAVTLLGPLENSLKNAAKQTLKSEVINNRGAVGAFRRLDPGVAAYAAISGKSPAAVSLHDQGVAMGKELSRLLDQLGSKVGAAEVSVLGYPNVAGQPQLPPVMTSTGDADLASADNFNDVTTAFRSRSVVYTFGTIGGTDYVRAGIPFRAAGGRWALAIRKPIDEIPAAVNAVAKAFLVAALAGLGLTLILGIPLAATLVRRLRRLRVAALSVTQEGPGVEVPADRSLDEVGDLARTFATMQRQLQRQEEARRAFIATASHELRTPLTSLDGMLELLEDDLRSGDVDLEETRAMLARARMQSRRLGRLAADLLDLSRLDAETKLRSEPVELGELCRAVLAEFEISSGERGISSALDAGAEQVWALGDPGSVARIVRILLDNALRASPASGEIRVVIEGGSPVALSVCDRGPGISAEDRATIFQRFQRGRATSGQGGFGLGLAIGRELAERMGGELVLDDEYGPGAKFTLRLPAARAPQAPPLAVGS